MKQPTDERVRTFALLHHLEEVDFPYGCEHEGESRQAVVVVWTRCHWRAYATRLDTRELACPWHAPANKARCPRW